jgi:hypothetical protein
MRVVFARRLLAVDRAQRSHTPNVVAGISVTRAPVLAHEGGQPKG